MTQIAIEFNKEGARLTQTCSFGVFGSQEVTKTLSYPEFSRLKLDFKLLAIEPVFQQVPTGEPFAQPNPPMLVAIKMTLEIADGAVATVPEPSKTLKRRWVPSNVIYLGSVPSLKQVGKVSRIWHNDSTMYVESFSSHSFIGILKETLKEAWHRLDPALRAKGTMNYNEFQKSISDVTGGGGSAWVAFAVLRYLGVIDVDAKWMGKRINYAIKPTYKILVIP